MWKTREMLPKSPYAGAACNVRLLCSEEDMVEGGHDSSGPQGIFPPSETKSAVWAYFGYYRYMNAQGQLDGKGWQHIQFT